MPAYSLTDLKSLHSALKAIGSVHGAYQAIGILKQAIEDVETDPTFDGEVKQLESKIGISYQGPDDANEQLLKAVKTASCAEQETQSAISELAALAITKLGVSQGTRAIAFLLAACGIHPSLTTVVLQICFLLAQTETGKSIVRAAIPDPNKLLPELPSNAKVHATFRNVAQAVGLKLDDIVDAVVVAPSQIASKLRISTNNLIDRMVSQDDETGSSSAGDT